MLFPKILGDPDQETKIMELDVANNGDIAFLAESDSTSIKSRALAKPIIGLIDSSNA